MFKILSIVILLTCNISIASTSLGQHESLFKADSVIIKGSKKVEAQAILEKMSIKSGMSKARRKIDKKAKDLQSKLN